MKFTLSWLKEHLVTEATLDEILVTLTRIGLEVESVEDKAAELAAFRVAHVRTATRHPNADKLQVCIVDTGAEDLAKGLDEAKVAAGKLSTGSKELTEPLKTAAANTAALDAKVNDLVTKVDDVTTKLQAKVGANPVPGQITGINAEVTAELNDAVAKLQAIDLPPAQEVATQLQAASGRLNEVNATLSGLVDQGDADAIAAIGEVRAQADALRKDIATLDEGVNQLAGGSDELVDGAAEFAAIIEDLSAGAEKLDKGFSTVLGKVPNRTEAQRDSVASALTTPVLLKEKTLNEADTFGTGFAPFFMSLSLFVAVSSSG